MHSAHENKIAEMSDFDSEGNFMRFMSSHWKWRFSRFRFQLSSTEHGIFGSVDGGKIHGKPNY